MPLKRLKGSNQIKFKIAVYEGRSLSGKALQIWNYLEDLKFDFDIIILNSGDNFGQMLTEQDRSGVDALRARKKYIEIFKENVIIRPVVLWNPFFEFDYFGDVKGVDINSSGDLKAQSLNNREGFFYRNKTRYTDYKYRVIRVTKAKMPAWVVLYHELGHVKQYYEGSGAISWNNRLNDTNDIEAENLEKHENPICRDIQKPIRAHYKHSTHGFAHLIQMYSAGQKSNAWKVANSTVGRRILEAKLKEEAEINFRTNPARGIYSCR